MNEARNLFANQDFSCYLSFTSEIYYHKEKKFSVMPVYIRIKMAINYNLFSFFLFAICPLNPFHGFKDLMYAFLAHGSQCLNCYALTEAYFHSLTFPYYY